MLDDQRAEQSVNRKTETLDQEWERMCLDRVATVVIHIGWVFVEVFIAVALVVDWDVPLPWRGVSEPRVDALNWGSFIENHLHYMDRASEVMYSLPDEFLRKLRNAVDMAPINKRTGRKAIMFTIFNLDHVSQAKNLLCSSIQVGLPRNYHVFIGLDSFAIVEMRKMGINPILFDVSDRKYGYYEICKLKGHIHIRLLLWNVETTVCDTDIVFLKDPRRLFKERSHFEVGDENAVFNWSLSHYNYDNFNVGFMRVLPSVMSIQVYQKWAFALRQVDGMLDQMVLHGLLAPYRKQSIKGPLQFYDIRNLIGRDKPAPNETFKIRWYGQLRVHNGGSMWMTVDQARDAAIKKGVNMPHVVHFCFMPPADKRPFAENAGLWFLEWGEQSCRIPDMRFFKPWSGR
jgi:hypothetical protein